MNIDFLDGSHEWVSDFVENRIGRFSHFPYFDIGIPDVERTLFLDGRSDVKILHVAKIFASVDLWIGEVIQGYPLTLPFWGHGFFKVSRLMSQEEIEKSSCQATEIYLQEDNEYFENLQSTSLDFQTFSNFLFSVYQMLLQCGSGFQFSELLDKACLVERSEIRYWHKTKISDIDIMCHPKVDEYLLTLFSKDNKLTQLPRFALDG